jgi:hypothetical protein
MVIAEFMYENLIGSIGLVVDMKMERFTIKSISQPSFQMKKGGLSTKYYSKLLV